MSLRPLCPPFSLPWLLAAGLSVGGCSFVPPLDLPKFAVPCSYRQATAPEQAPLPWKLALTEPIPPDPWQIFELPEASALLARLETANASLAVSRARYAEATTLIAQARSGLFPALSGGAAATWARSNGSRKTATTDSVLLAGSWEIDLWGRLRANVEASEASAQASNADLAGVRLALQSQLMQALLALRVVEAQRQLLDATVADYQRYVKLTTDRIRFGVSSRADLALAETQLYSAEAQAIATGIQRSQLINAIAVLVGEIPANFILPARAAAQSNWRAPLRDTGAARALAPAGQPLANHAEILDQVPQLPTIPLSAPSTLLERRPDIAAAERRAVAANAQVGIAAAAFFPVLDLTGSAGYRSAGWADLLTAPARFWTIGPALAGPLFDAGLRSAQKAQAVAVWEEASAGYRQTVLSAFQEVEDQLASLRVLADQARVEEDAVAAARVGAELTLAQYRAGTAGSLQVIITNSALLLAERSALDLHGQRLDAAVALIKALGGGWQGAALAAASDAGGG